MRPLRRLCAWRPVAASLALALVSACGGAKVKPEAAPQEKPAEVAPPPDAPALPEGVKAIAPPPEEKAPAPAVSDDVRRKAKDAFTEALGAMEEGDDGRALPLFTQASELDPSLQWAAYDAGVLLARQGRTDEAVERFQRALRARPDFVEASENLLRLRLKRRELQLAEQELAGRVGRFPGNLALRIQYVRVLIAQQKLDPALLEAKKVLKADERNVPALLALADVWYRQRKNELARDVLENAAAIAPADAEVANAQGFVLLATDQKALAIEAFKRATLLRPEFAEAHNNLGALLNEASDFEGAIAELQQASKVMPDASGIWVNLGNAYRGARRYDEAEAAYAKALALAPRASSPLFNLGILYLDGDIKGKPALDRLTQALTYFDKFKQAGGQDVKLVRYEAEAQKSIKKERDRIAREERDKLKKAEAAQKLAAEKQRREAGKLGSKDDDEGPARTDAPSGKIGGKEDEK